MQLLGTQSSRKDYLLLEMHGLESLLDRLCPPTLLPHNQQLDIVLAPGLEPIKGREQPGQVLTRMQRAHEHKIRMSVAILLSNLLLLFCRQRTKDFVHPIVCHINLPRINMITIHNILLRELRHRHDTIGPLGKSREILFVMPKMDSRHVVGEMLEVKVMKLNHLWHLGTQTQVAVGREEQVRFDFSQRPSPRIFEEPDKEEGVSCLREKRHRFHVVGKEEHRVGLAVEEEVKLHFGVTLHHTAKGLIGHPADAFQLAFQQQPCVDSDSHHHQYL